MIIILKEKFPNDSSFDLTKFLNYFIIFNAKYLIRYKKCFNLW